MQQQYVILSKGNVIFLPHVVFSSYSHQVDPSFAYKMSQKIDFNYNGITLPNLQNVLLVLELDVLSHVKNKVALFLFSLKIRQIWAIGYMFRHSIYCVVSLHMLHSSGLCKLYFASFYLGLMLDLCTPQGIIFSTTYNFILTILLLLLLYKFINKSIYIYICKVDFKIKDNSILQTYINSCFSKHKLSYVRREQSEFEVNYFHECVPLAQ